MAQPKAWLDEIIDALKDIGGDGQYEDIYESIKQRGIMNLSVKDYKAQVRGTIERFSSDSDVYQQGNKDIFYAVEGIGKGHWGLRNFEPKEGQVNLTEDDNGFPEGKKMLRQHIYKERNPRVIMLAKKKFKEEHGKLYCEICGFDFEKEYGKIGKDFIEGHHIIPVSEIPQGYKTKPEDIIMVCSNCHKMIHRKRPWLTKDKLKELLKH